MTRVIDLDAGGIEFTDPVIFTDALMQDVTDDLVEISLGSWVAPLAWLTPDTVAHPATDSVSAQLLIGDDLKPAPGDYWVWVRLTDSPGRIPRRAINRTRVVNSGSANWPPVGLIVTGSGVLSGVGDLLDVDGIISSSDSSLADVGGIISYAA